VIKYHTSPFSNASCRIQDSADFKRLTN